MIGSLGPKALDYESFEGLDFWGFGGSKNSSIRTPPKGAKRDPSPLEEFNKAASSSEPRPDERDSTSYL